MKFKLELKILRVLCIFFAMVALKFLLSVFIFRNARYEYSTIVVLDEMTNDPWFRTRLILYLCYYLGHNYANIMWFVYVFIYAIDSELLTLYFKPKLGEAKSAVIGWIFLYSPAVFYAYQPSYYIGNGMEDSVVYLGLFISLILYNQKREWALYAQFVCVFIKEIIPLIVILFYIIDNATTIRQMWDRVMKPINIPIIITIAEFLTVRIYFSFALPIAPFTNPFNASWVYVLLTGSDFAPITLSSSTDFNYPYILWRVFLGLNFFWIGLVGLCSSKFRSARLVFIAYFIFLMGFGWIWESNKTFILLPFLVEPTLSVIDYFDKKIFGDKIVQESDSVLNPKM